MFQLKKQETLTSDKKLQQFQQFNNPCGRSSIHPVSRRRGVQVNGLITQREGTGMYVRAQPDEILREKKSGGLLVNTKI